LNAREKKILKDVFAKFMTVYGSVLEALLKRCSLF